MAQLTEADLREYGGESSIEAITQLTLRSQRLTTLEPFCSRLLCLEVLSLSHNRFERLSGFHHLKQLKSLNLNHNALTSLDGLQACTQLELAFFSGNRISSITPLASCPRLRCLCLYRNRLSRLDAALAVLGKLHELRELELAGNACSQAECYREQLLQQLPALTSIDGEPASAEERRRAAAAAAACSSSSSPRPEPAPEGLPRPATAPAPGRFRSRTAVGDVPVTFRDELLGQHPVLLEYIAASSLAHEADSTGEASGRRSFAERLRATAAKMHALKGVPPEELQPDDVIPAAQTAKQDLLPGAGAEEMVRRLASHVESLRAELRRVQEASAPETSLSRSEAELLARRLVESERENRRLRAENRNLGWLQEENRELKRREAALRQQLLQLQPTISPDVDEPVVSSDPLDNSPPGQAA